MVMCYGLMVGVCVLVMVGVFVGCVGERDSETYSSG